MKDFDLFLSRPLYDCFGFMAETKCSLECRTLIVGTPTLNARGTRIFHFIQTRKFLHQNSSVVYLQSSLNSKAQKIDIISRQ